MAVAERILFKISDVVCLSREENRKWFKFDHEDGNKSTDRIRYIVYNIFLAVIRMVYPCLVLRPSVGTLLRYDGRIDDVEIDQKELF